MWVIVLYLAGMALLFTELFVPGGLLGVVGGAMVLYALVTAWWEAHYVLAIPMTVGTLIAIPAMISFALRRLALRAELSNEAGFSSAEVGLDELVGAQGVSLTALRPSGTARFGERRLSVVAETGLIEPETQVEVVRVEGNRIVVRVV